MTPRDATPPNPITAVARRGTAGRRGKIFFLFLDGVGIGRKDGPENPFFSMPLPGFESLLGGPMISPGRPSRTNEHSSVRPIDATLGVRGLPQSGTGQSDPHGENAAKILEAFIALLPASAPSEKNLQASFRPWPLADVHQHSRGSMRTTSRTSLRSGVSLPGGRRKSAVCSADLTAGRALSSDCNGRLGTAWVSGCPSSPLGRSQVAFGCWRPVSASTNIISPITPATDARERRILSVLDALRGVCGLDNARRLRQRPCAASGPRRNSIRRPVPFICAGRGHRRLCADVRDLTDIVPALLDYSGRRREAMAGRPR